jgi:hypothetical protein
VSEEAVRRLAETVGLPLTPEREAEVAALLETLSRDGAGVTAEDVAAVEPATSFDPRWPS